MAYHPDKIDIVTIKELLRQYQDVVKSGLEELDKHRYETVPQELRSQRESKEITGLEKPSFLKLVDWKLRHGTFRPSLQKLTASNEPEEVSRASRNAFKIAAEADYSPGSIKEALGELNDLRGVGPATSSLILSCFEPAHIPFFSDELYQWLHYDVEDPKKGHGWGRKIGYTAKEYASLLERARSLLTRLNDGDKSTKAMTMFDLEKAAYVLGKQEMDVEKVEKVEKSADEVTKVAKTHTESQPTQVKKPKDAHKVKSEASKRKAKDDPVEQQTKRTRAVTRSSAAATR